MNEAIVMKIFPNHDIFNLYLQNCRPKKSYDWQTDTIDFLIDV